MPKALIVDDDLMNTKLMEVVFKKIDWESESILRDYLDILTRPDLADISLIMMDYNLKDMTGDEVIKKLRTDANYKGPIWLVSASPKEDEIQKSIDAGANKIVKKPFNIMDVSEMVKSLE